MGARNRVGIGLSNRPARLNSWRNQFFGIDLGLLKSLRIRALGACPPAWCLGGHSPAPCAVSRPRRKRSSRSTLSTASRRGRDQGCTPPPPLPGRCSRTRPQHGRAAGIHAPGGIWVLVQSS